MNNLPKTIKKLIFTNQYTFEDISAIVDLSVEECISEFESYYNTPIPPSLLVVGNTKQRNVLKEFIQSNIPVYLHGPNGIGKDVALRQIAAELGLILRKINVDLRVGDYQLIMDIIENNLRKSRILIFS